MKQKLNFIGNLIALLTLLMYVSSFKTVKNRNPERSNADFSPAACTGKGKLQSISYRDTMIINGDIESESRVSLSECPFSKEEIYIDPNENTDWDYNSIMKDTYVKTTVEGYFVKNANDNLKTLVIIYNPAEKKKLKMVIQGTPAGDNTIRYRFMSTTGTMHFEITVQNDKEGHDVQIGTAPDTKSLGQDLVRLTKKATTEGTGCLRNTGFTNCIICSQHDCNATWYCMLVCGPASITCIAAWIISCAILN